MIYGENRRIFYLFSCLAFDIKSKAFVFIRTFIFLSFSFYDFVKCSFSPSPRLIPVTISGKFTKKLHFGMISESSY